MKSIGEIRREIRKLLAHGGWMGRFIVLTEPDGEDVILECRSTPEGLEVFVREGSYVVRKDP